MKIFNNKIILVLTTVFSVFILSQIISCKREVETQYKYVFSNVSPVTFSSEDAGDNGIKITLATSTDGAEIYYTTDGTEPDSGSTKYSGTITFNSDTTINAVAVKSGSDNSPVSVAKIIIKTKIVEVSTGGNSSSGASTSEDAEITFDGKSFSKTAFVDVIAKGSTKTIPDDGNCTFTGDVFWQKSETSYRKITLDYFSMSKYEVTQELFEAVMGYIPFADEENLYGTETQKLRPAAGMNWYDAAYFCNKLSELCGYEPVYTISSITYKNKGTNSQYIKSATVTWDPDDLTKNGFRLPTEAEWEFAARGAGLTAADWSYTYSGSDNSKKVSWTSQNSSGYSDDDETLRTHQVGSKAPNALGIYDMSGNVSEWCADFYRSVTENNDFDHGNAVNDLTESTNPCMEKGEYDNRVIRGGAYNSDPYYSKISSRFFDGTNHCYANPNQIKNSGIRLVRRK